MNYSAKRKLKKHLHEWSKRILIALAVCIVLLVLYRTGAEFLPSSLQPAAPDTARIHMLDVGQGDCILLEQNGHYALIDTGPSGAKDLLTSYLDCRGIHTLDYLILTHFHSDHIGNALPLLQNYRVKNVLLSDSTLGPAPTGATSEKLLKEILKQQKGGTLTVSYPVIGDTFPLGDGVIRVIGVGIPCDDLNSTSLITEFVFSDITFLSGGDAAADAEAVLLDNSTVDPDADIFKVSHHGSNSANSEAYLAAVTPKTALISCGANNDYGHPHDPVLKRLSQYTTDIYRTDRHGTIVVTVRGGDYTVRTEKKDK